MRHQTHVNNVVMQDQARSYDEATASPLGTYLKSSQNRYLSHPLPVMRAREIDRWALGSTYQQLLKQNAAH
jgi:aspartate carbamoyltransferase catalytic subunit